MRHLYLKFNGHRVPGIKGSSARWDSGFTTYLSSLFPDGTVSRNEVVAVFCSGKKEVIRLGFDDDSHLILTPDHPISVGNNEYVMASELCVGHTVTGRGTLKCKEPVGKRPLKDRPDRVVINTKYYPNGSVKIVECNGMLYRYKRVNRARLVYEAAMNGISYDEFVDALKNDEVLSQSFVYLDVDMDVHHVDENPLNDVIGNLEALHHSGHAKHHATEMSFNKDYVRDVKVTGMTSFGTEMTYDVQMQSPANNYCANGIFVHNTGKTTVIRELVDRTPGRFAVCAYTGKATQVLRRKGIPASTIHSLIYKPEPDDDGGVHFVRKHDYEVDFRGVIIDEASMVSAPIHSDLMSFDVPLIYIGDHGQLPPVGSDGFNLMDKPDITLERIHRNAGQIARFAEHLRHGNDARDWPSSDQVTILTPEQFQQSDCITSSDQMICAYNNTRVVFNNIVREHLGYDELPQPGDRIMCLQNSRDDGLFNGMQGIIQHIDHDRARLTFVNDELSVRVRYSREAFGVGKPPKRQMGVIPFDYAYCVTCHKAQGDEWDHVLVIEQRCGAWEHSRWAYTAASRAKDRLTWVLD